MLHLLDFLGEPQFSHWSQNVLTTHHFYLAIFLPIAPRIILFLTIQYNYSLRKNNYKQCLANFFSYIELITFFLSALEFFFPFIFLYGIYILDMRSISVSGSSANVLVMSTENNLQKYFPNILLLVFY